MNQVSFKLLLDSKQFPIPTKFSRLTDVSNDIYESLIFTPQHQYQIKSKVTDEVLKNFIQYWINEEVPDINVENFFQYSELSNEFHILQEQVQEKKKELEPLLNKENIENQKQISNLSKELSLEDELNQLESVIKDNKAQIDSIEQDVSAMKAIDEKKMKEMTEIINKQSGEIKQLKESQEEELKKFNENQTQLFSEFKKSFQSFKKDVVSMKYKHAQNTDKLKKKINEQSGRLKEIQESGQNTPNPPKILFTKKDHTKRNPGRAVDVLYDSTESGRFKGIINYLTEECNGGNVHKEGAVEITSSSVLPNRPGGLKLPLLPFLQIPDIDENADYNPYNAADLNDRKSCFESDDRPNSWLCYDFIDAKVRPNMYSIRTYKNGHSHMQSWCIEGSNDKVNWDRLDQQSNNRSLNDTGSSNTFTINGDKVAVYYRYLRIKQTDKNIGGSNILNISALEFFGSLYE